MITPRPVRVSSAGVCVCGHTYHVHDYREGCIKFLCCTRSRNLFPGKRHTEHDGVNHTVQHCLCKTYKEGE